MIIKCISLLLLLVASSQAQIQWNGNWAMGCDFRGNDLTNAQVRGEDCSIKCESTPGCTHFVWTTYNGGTCWMKKGAVAKSDAFASGIQSMVCGIGNGNVKWNGNWALACDFKGRDLANARTTGEQCGNKCDQTSGCTHFAWNSYNGGTCWMKSGAVDKSDCFYTGDNGRVCGIAGSAPPPPSPTPQPSPNPTSVSRNANEVDVLTATLYAEARGEPDEGMEWVTWVIKNRVALNRSYWGGNTIKGVCLAPMQFECWNGLEAIVIDDAASYRRSAAIVQKVLSSSTDPTGGCDHYNNPDKEGYPPWTNNCYRIRKIGNHQFYKSK